MLSLRAFSQWHSVFSQWYEFSPSPSTSDLRASSIFTTSRVRGLDDGPRLHRSLLFNDRFHGLERLLRGLVDGLRLSDLWTVEELRPQGQFQRALNGLLEGLSGLAATPARRENGRLGTLSQLPIQGRQ